MLQISRCACLRPEPDVARVILDTEPGGPGCPRPAVGTARRRFSQALRLLAFSPGRGLVVAWLLAAMASGQAAWAQTDGNPAVWPGPLPHADDGVVSAVAQEPASAAVPAAGLPLDFEQAAARLAQVSDALMAARANVGNKQALERAAQSLRLPELSLDVREIRFQKTMNVALGPAGQALAPLGIPPVIDASQGGWRLRPTLSLTMPLYTGGQIPAAQRVAGAAVGQADAERMAEEQHQLMQLVQLYFGHQLAEQALKVRREVLDGLERHVQEAGKLERGGLATRAQRLQAEVARDQAARDLQKAETELATLADALQRLLRSPQGVLPRSPLFVLSRPLGDVSRFQEQAQLRHPSLRKLRAQVEQASQGVLAQQASLKPQLYLFGQKDLRRKDALLTDPDWIVGVGVRYTFLSGTDRPSRIGAAREQQWQAEAGLREAANQVSIGVTRAWNQLETARRQFLLLDSSLAQAAENLRLQSLSFREGQATSLDVIDARLRLGAVGIERAQAAYQYDVALAGLLDVSGQMQDFSHYLAQADKVILP